MVSNLEATRTTICLFILLTLTACSDRVRPPPIPDGAYFQINPARWQNQVAVRP